MTEHVDVTPDRDPPPAFAALARQFLRFGIVGAFGFLVDTAVVYTLRSLVGLYVAGLISYVIAATANWAIHRAWTFRGMGSGPAHRQWLLFLSTNLGGFALNRGAYSALIFFSPLCRAHPVLAIAAGAGAGMFLNFHLSRTVAFR